MLHIIPCPSRAMMASLTSRFVFLHVPKAAGKSIRGALLGGEAHEEKIINAWGIHGNLDHAHLLPAQLRAHYPRAWQLLQDPASLTFAVVRDPIDRALSAFREHQRQYGTVPGSAGSFGSYLEKIAGRQFLDPRTGFMFVHGIPQHEFLVEEGRLLVKRLFRLDSPDLGKAVSDYLDRQVWLAGPEPSTAAIQPNPSSHDLRLARRIYREDFRFFDAVSIQ